MEGARGGEWEDGGDGGWVGEDVVGIVGREIAVSSVCLDLQFLVCHWGGGGETLRTVAWWWIRCRHLCYRCSTLQLGGKSAFNDVSI